MDLWVKYTGGVKFRYVLAGPVWLFGFAERVQRGYCQHKLHAPPKAIAIGGLEGAQVLLKAIY